MVLILGAGKSGISAKKFLESRGKEVAVYDDKNPVKITEVIELCVISPGVSINHPLAVKYSDRLISELELGISEKHKKVIAITGTNGKTTVVNMIHNALTKNKNLFARKSVLCGNVGTPVTAITQQLRNKTAVIEVSSFQLEHAKTFRPKIAVILNINQDHLERHGTMEEYARCKAKISENQKRRDVLILNYDCSLTRSLAQKESSLSAKKCRQGSHNRVLYFSTSARVRGVYLSGKSIILNIKGRARKIFTLDDFGADAPHTIENILATVLVCKLMRVSKRAIIEACKNFPNPHRLEYAGSFESHTG